MWRLGISVKGKTADMMRAALSQGPWDSDHLCPGNSCLRRRAVHKRAHSHAFHEGLAAQIWGTSRQSSIQSLIKHPVITHYNYITHDYTDLKIQSWYDIIFSAEQWIALPWLHMFGLTPLTSCLKDDELFEDARSVHFSTEAVQGCCWSFPMCPFKKCYQFSSASEVLSQRASAIAHWSDVGRYPTLGFQTSPFNVCWIWLPGPGSKVAFKSVKASTLYVLIPIAGFPWLWHSTLLWSRRGGRRAVCHWILETHGNTWKHMETHGNTWKHMETHGNTRKHMETHGNTWKHMETHGNTWKHMETHGNTWKHMETHGNTWKHMETHIWQRLSNHITCWKRMEKGQFL